MNKIKLIQSFIIFMIISTFSAKAQMPDRPARPERPTAIKRAERRANEMAFAVNLDSKQYKKIYQIYLKEENAKDAAMENFAPMGPPPADFRGGMPPMGAGAPPRPGMGGDFSGPKAGGSPAGMPFPGGMGEMKTPKVGGKDINSDEYIDAREAKFKKILTPEQYAIWRELHPDPTGFFHK